MTKKEADLIIAEENKNKEKILKAVAKVKSDYNELCNLKDMRIAELEKENRELKSRIVNYIVKDEFEYSENYGKRVQKERSRLVNDNTSLRVQLTEAKEYIRTLISCLVDWVQEGDKDYCHIVEAKDFIKE